MENSFKKKIENFWFYNKWKVAAFAVVFITVVMAVAQCSSRPNNDYTLVLFTYSDYIDEQLERMGKYLSQYGEDINGDGEVTVGFNHCSFDSELANGKYQQEKIIRLQSTIISEPTQMLFLTDEESFKFLDGLFGDSDLFLNLSLPENEGRAYLLPEEFYDAAEVRGHRPANGLRISMRVGEGTEDLGAKDLPKHVASAKAFLEKLFGEEIKN